MAGGGTDIWTFATALYDREGVKEALLWLQDERQLDVPLLLFMLWSAEQRELAREEILHYQVLSNALSENLVAPLRRIRRWLKSTFPERWALYDELLKTELGGEKLLMEELEAQFHLTPPSPIGAGPGGGVNALRYLALANLSGDEETRRRLDKILNQLPSPGRRH